VSGGSRWPPDTTIQAPGTSRYLDESRHAVLDVDDQWWSGTAEPAPQELGRA